MWSLDLPHPYGPSRPVTGIALLFILWLIILQVLSVCTSQLRLLSVITPMKLVFLLHLFPHSLSEFLIYFPVYIFFVSGREYSVFWLDLEINY
jgi:hypothetical protein